MLEQKGVPFRATSRLRSGEVIDMVREAMATPFRYFAVEAGAHKEPHSIGHRNDHHDPASVPGAVLVERSSR